MPQSEFNLRLMEEFRSNGGMVPSWPFRGDSMLLLTTTGRKSGEPRTSPMGYWRDGDGLYLKAMNGGQEQVPNWYFNLLANPEVSVELGTETFRARAVVLEDAEGQRLLTTFAEAEPQFKAAWEKMTRRVPVVRLERL